MDHSLQYYLSDAFPCSQLLSFSFPPQVCLSTHVAPGPAAKQISAGIPEGKPGQQEQQSTAGLLERAGGQEQGSAGSSVLIFHGIIAQLWLHTNSVSYR